MSVTLPVAKRGKSGVRANSWDAMRDPAFRIRMVSVILYIFAAGLRNENARAQDRQMGPIGIPIPAF